MSCWSDSLALAVYFSPPRAFIVWLHSVVDGNVGSPACRKEIDYFLYSTPFLSQYNGMCIDTFHELQFDKEKTNGTAQESCCLAQAHRQIYIVCVQLFLSSSRFHLTNWSSSSLFHLHSFILQPPQWCLHSVSEILDIWSNIWWGKQHSCPVFITKLCQAATGKKREKSDWFMIVLFKIRWIVVMINGMAVPQKTYFHSNRNMYNSLQTICNLIWRLFNGRICSFCQSYVSTHLQILGSIFLQSVIQNGQYEDIITLHWRCLC